MKRITAFIGQFLLAFLFTMQIASAQQTKPTLYLPGFGKGISGVDFNYRSPLPENEDAYILRNSFENPEMNWKTAPVTQSVSSAQVAFVFMAAMSTDKTDLGFTLKVNNGEEFNFSNIEDKTWSVKGSQGGQLTFYQAKNIYGVEINGFMILTLPANRLKQKEPVDIKVNLLPTSKSAWIIIFKKSLQSGNTLSNTSILAKENGVLSQQVRISQVQFREPCGITFSYGGKELLTSKTKIGYNQFFVPVPSVKAPKKLEISLKYETGLNEKVTGTQLPTKKWEIYLIQHAHTDIGYTRPQSEILAEHLRYIDYALDYCDQTDNMPDDAKFRWTCESTWVVREYLRTRPKTQIERFKKRIGEGRIEVTGMYFNMAEIADENIMFDYFQPLKEIKDQGITVKTTMQNDVNGVAWCLPDYLKNTSVKYLTMGINETRSILPFFVPTCFW